MSENEPYFISQAEMVVEINRLRERLAEADECNRRVSDENKTLRRDVRTAVMGDSAELQDVKRENEKLRDVIKNCIAALRHAYFHGFTELYKTTADEAAAAIWESGE